MFSLAIEELAMFFLAIAAVFILIDLTTHVSSTINEIAPPTPPRTLDENLTDVSRQVDEMLQMFK